jgi:hypothetical protein
VDVRDVEVTTGSGPSNHSLRLVVDLFVDLSFAGDGHRLHLSLNGVSSVGLIKVVVVVVVAVADEFMFSLSLVVDS